MLPDVNDAELQVLRTRLETELRAIREQGDVVLEHDGDDSEVRKPDEDGAPLVEMSQVIASNRNRSHAAQVGAIEAALVRLQEDPSAFGLCEDCDEPIPFRRLQLVPWVRLCLACQSEREQRDGPQNRRHPLDYR